ncbi:MAG TPA: pantoate--beta-alanine ligase [Vicinamibacterales bacterium]
MQIVQRIDEARAALDALRPRGTVGFVPTMGALHDGHAALFRTARAECAVVATSAFVNPLQFDDPQDLAAYPPPGQEDARIAESEGVDVYFVPPPQEIYPHGHATRVEIGGPAVGFEGAARPGHFAGVATVCLKLFSIVRPDVVYLGQKDAQQVAVLRQLVRDVHLPLEIRVVPTVREPDGLARSSRNARLSPAERARAAAIPRALRRAVEAHRTGGDPAAAARAALEGFEIDYVDVAHFDGRPTLVLAVRLGRTRLIDNVPLDDPGMAGL